MAPQPPMMRPRSGDDIVSNDHPLQTAPSAIVDGSSSSSSAFPPSSTSPSPSAASSGSTAVGAPLVSPASSPVVTSSLASGSTTSFAGLPDLIEFWDGAENIPSACAAAFLENTRQIPTRDRIRKLFRAERYEECDSLIQSLIDKTSNSSSSASATSASEFPLNALLVVRVRCLLAMPKGAQKAIELLRPVVDDFLRSRSVAASQWSLLTLYSAALCSIGNPFGALRHNLTLSEFCAELIKKTAGKESMRWKARLARLRCQTATIFVSIHHFQRAVDSLMSISGDSGEIRCAVARIYLHAGLVGTGCRWLADALRSPFSLPSPLSQLIHKGLQFFAQGSYNECYEIFVAAESSLVCQQNAAICALYEKENSLSVARSLLQNSIRHTLRSNRKIPEATLRAIEAIYELWHVPRVAERQKSLLRTAVRAVLESPPPP